MIERKAFHPLPGWAHRRPVTAFMLFISVLVLGIFATIQLPLEFAPEISNRWMWVWIPYANSTPEETDELIGVTMEEELKRVRFVKRLEVTSGSNGASISLEFKTDADMDTAYMEVRDAYERARVTFPSNADRIFIHRNNSDDWPILWLGIAYGNDTETLYRLVDDRIKPALERIEGVAQVEAHGAQPESLHIDLDLDRVRAHGVNIASVTSELMQAQANPSVGTVEEAGKKGLIRTQYKLDSVDDYRDLPLENGRLHLRDIADIDRRLPERDAIHRINGQEGFTISVSKESEANTVAVGETVMEVLRKLEQDPELKGIQFLPFFNQSNWIKTSLTSLFNAGLWGALFAAIILYLFIRRASATAIVLTAVPLSLLSALLGLFFTGFSLNIGTMMGLMLAIGMLVDNSVVVAENIFRLRKNGVERKQASILGAARVGTAITASTLTTIIVFLPLIFAKGEMGVWMKQIGVPITLSLLASLIIALTLVPLAITMFIRKPVNIQSRIIPLIIKQYVRSLDWILTHRLISVLLIAAILGSTAFPFDRIEKSMNDGGGQRELVIRMNMPENYTLEDSERVLKQLETILMAHRDEIDLKNLYTTSSGGSGRLRLFLNDTGSGLIPDPEIKRRIREYFPNMPGISWWFGWRGGASSEANMVDVTLKGNSNTELQVLAESVCTHLERMEEVIDARTATESPMDEIHVTINRDITRRNGLTSRDVARTVSVALMGQSLPRFQGNDREIDVWLQLRKEDRENLHQLQNLLLYNRDGQPIPLKSLAEFNIVPGKGEISRIDGKIHQTIQIETDTEDMKSIRKSISKQMDTMRLPAGYTWSYGRSFMEFDAGMEELGQVFLLALILVILLLGALFESLIHPFTIIISLPFAMVGVYWTLYFTDTVLNFMGNIGLVILIGIVVNNAIVLVDHINQLRGTGLDRRKALLQAGEDRLRPIVMTAATTILGLAPMAFSKSQASAQMYSAMAITVMGGLFASTVLTLLVLPLIYHLMDDLQSVLKRLFISLKPSILSSPSESTAVQSTTPDSLN